MNRRHCFRSAAMLLATFATQHWRVQQLLGQDAPVAPPAPLSAIETSNSWGPEIDQFERLDALHPPQPGGLLFAGSSSIRLWPLADSFPGYNCTNRGFGGSRMEHLAQYMSRIIHAHQPRLVVLFSDNDLAGGRTPEQIRSDFTTTRQTIARLRPGTPVVLYSIKPSPLRWPLAQLSRQANALLQHACEQTPLTTFLDVWPDMLGPDGLPRPELYVADRLHLSPAGYAIWTRLLQPHLM